MAVPRRRADPHTLVGAYAMDAVSEQDRSSFERHLGGCDTCQAELHGLRETTARLASATEVRPRDELRAQTVQAALRIPQLPPALPGHPERATLPRSPLARFRPGRTHQGRTHQGRTRRAASWPLRLAAAALGFAVAAGLIGIVRGMDHRLDTAQRRSHAIAAVLGAPDAVMLTAKVTTGGRATVVMSHRDRELVFTAAHLAPLPGTRSYELWLMSPAGDRSAGLLPAPRNGMTGPMVISGLAAGDMVGITVEPASGSARPTSAPILMLVLSPGGISPAGGGRPSG
jgi:anti-sigma-K factor RskA